ncbi:hypothetical protein WMY93_013169 [Mugilogobius chulae]|uniref:Biogenesis of lysosome-related organelles complex 1 subunit 6 n=1 Tax=Mugilogobius chulae TaxID=88201 RepID=A0AAW0NZ90_9GOBI
MLNCFTGKLTQNMMMEAEEEEGPAPVSHDDQSQQSEAVDRSCVIPTYDTLHVQYVKTRCGAGPGASCRGAVEDRVCVDRVTVDRLTEGLLNHYLPDLHNSKRILQELTQNQVILLDTLDQEVTKFRDCNALLDLNSLFTEAKIYHNKLVNIRKEMILIHEKTTKLKKKALKMQQQKQRDLFEKEQQREKELERERQLTAKPAKRT